MAVLTHNLQPGDRVQVRLSNGHTDTGTIVRVFKNGRVGVREDSGRYHVRYVRQWCRLDKAFCTVVAIKNLRRD